MLFTLQFTVINYMPQLNANNMVYILHFKDPSSFLIHQTLSLYQGFNWGASDPKADDIPM